MTSDASEFLFRVEVPFGPRWQHVELLRTSILQCLSTLFQSHDFCEQLSMVAAELLENAIHYGRWEDEAARPFRLAVRGLADEITIEVANPIDVTSPQAQRLRAAVEDISASTVKEAYLERMRQLAERPDEPGSGLGLMRIVYETGCSLRFELADGAAVVRAIIPRGSSS